MILAPVLDDYKITGYYLGKIIIGIALLMAIPFIIAVLHNEIEPAVNFLLSISIALLLGLVITAVCHTKKDLATKHAMSVAALSWLAAMFISAIPLVFSGHFASYLDACFEAMSGYATTGLSLAVDLDHMAGSYNFWRHLTMFIGGQGIVVIALTFLFKGTAGAFRMYVGEARDEKILPNVIETARFIWLVSMIYLVIGSAALSISAINGGLKPAKAVFDSVCIFMAAWDTGGFTPQSQNILFYHNFPFEIITASLMFLGAVNFAFHYAVWTGNRRELYRNIEIVTLFITMIATLSVTAWGLVGRGIYADAVPFFRKVFYHLISGHTGTGYSTIYARQFVNEWGPLAMLGITIAMAIGGSVCSTTGAIKLLRIGVIYKALRQDIKKLLIPESAILIQKIHHIKDFMLEDRHVRVAAIILISYINLYLLGTIAGMLYGHPLENALFESVSAAANVGLSCGITSPSMPAALKVVYMLQMWAGRLEFIAIFTLGGMVLAALKGRRE
ncbi:MAG: TrkH family potassium uptake protein [Candidatus Omnitrophota bacterium]|nr:TrkH family potassium uptake protein [Candidatus Omnitrophota bacterium]